MDVSEDTLLDRMLSRFGDNLPRTRVFSAFAREVTGDIDVADDPDAALMAWMDKEEILFRTFEKYLVGERLAQGFGDDVDAFIQFSLSVQNRRKSRVGQALENHLEQIFSTLGLRHRRSAETENKSKVDFLFPGLEEYHDDSFDSLKLTALGAKSTCKDRWRQVLSEAKWIKRKHLITLETAISTNQTHEMEANLLHLVVPRSLQSTDSPEQQDWLMDLSGFCEMVRDRQMS